MTLPLRCGCYEDTGGFHPCAAHSGAQAVSVPDIIVTTPTITIQPGEGRVTPEPWRKLALNLCTSKRLAMPASDHGTDEPCRECLALVTAALAARREPETGARQWDCWVNVYPDGTVMPYTGEVKARQMRSTLTDVETVRARVVEVSPAPAATAPTEDDWAPNTPHNPNLFAAPTHCTNCGYEMSAHPVQLSEDEVCRVAAPTEEYSMVPLYPGQRPFPGGVYLTREQVKAIADDVWEEDGAAPTETEREAREQTGEWDARVRELKNLEIWASPRPMTNNPHFVTQQEFRRRAENLLDEMRSALRLASVRGTERGAIDLTNLTGCCADCGAKPRISQGPLNGSWCIGIVPSCDHETRGRVYRGFNLWPADESLALRTPTASAGTDVRELWLQRLELYAGGEWDTSPEALQAIIAGLRSGAPGEPNP
jgi:hypothetical protein